MAIANRLNTLLLVLLVIMAGAIIAILATRAAGGPLDPPGPPASTLPQVEPRTPIDHLPFTISQSGSYFLTKNLTGDGASDGITVDVSNVTIDLNGFTLSGTGKTHNGIVTILAVSGISIAHGVVTNWLDGINIFPSRGGAIRDVEAAGNGGYGIDSAQESILSDCTAHDDGFGGVIAEADTQVTGCTLTGNGNFGVEAYSKSTVERNLIEDNPPGFGNVYIAFLATNVTIADNDMYNASGPDVNDNGSDNVIIRNRVTSCSTIDPGVDTYAPITKTSGAGSLAVGLVNTNIALGPNGAGLC